MRPCPACDNPDMGGVRFTPTCEFGLYCPCGLAASMPVRHGRQSLLDEWETRRFRRATLFFVDEMDPDRIELDGRRRKPSGSTGLGQLWLEDRPRWRSWRSYRVVREYRFADEDGTTYAYLTEGGDLVGRATPLPTLSWMGRMTRWLRRSTTP